MDFLKATFSPHLKSVTVLRANGSCHGQSTDLRVFQWTVLPGVLITFFAECSTSCNGSVGEGPSSCSSNDTVPSPFGLSTHLYLILCFKVSYSTALLTNSKARSKSKVLAPYRSRLSDPRARKRFERLLSRAKPCTRKIMFTLLDLVNLEEDGTLERASNRPRLLVCTSWQRPF